MLLLFCSKNNSIFIVCILLTLLGVINLIGTFSNTWLSAVFGVPVSVKLTFALIGLKVEPINPVPGTVVLGFASFLRIDSSSPRSSTAPPAPL